MKKRRREELSDRLIDYVFMAIAAFVFYVLILLLP